MQHIGIKSGWTAGALLAGLLAGFFNGTIIARLNVPPFIVTLGMAGIVRGLGFVMSGLYVSIRLLTTNLGSIIDFASNQSLWF